MSHDAKQINTLDLANTDFLLMYLLNNMRFNIQSHKDELKKIQINCVIFELISQLLSSLYLCNQQSVILKKTLISSL